MKISLTVAHKSSKLTKKSVLYTGEKIFGETATVDPVLQGEALLRSTNYVDPLRHGNS